MRASAKKILKTVIHQKHPDVYLAMANLEDNLDERAEWINKTNRLYKLAPIEFVGSTYEDLTAVRHHETEGTKVTIIMPAYNAADGIETGINTTLNQAWKNIEINAV